MTAPTQPDVVHVEPPPQSPGAHPGRRASDRSTGRPPGPPNKPLLVLLLVPAVAALALWAFAWPAARSAPHAVPVGITGSAEAAARVEARLTGTGDAFALYRYADAADARRAVREHEVYGAVVARHDGTTLLTAPAASPAVARLLQRTFAPAPRATGPDRVEAVVPLPETDARGAALPAAVLPLVVAGIVAGVLCLLLVRPVLLRIPVLLGASALVGLVASGMLQGWLGVIGGSWSLNAGAAALTVLAVSVTLCGLASLIGPRGIGITAVLMALLGNPFSGVTSAPELLPEPVGMLGRLLPPGAGGTLLRSTAYFDAHQAAGPVMVLAAWATLGCVLVLAAAGRAAPAPPSPTQTGTPPSPAAGSTSRGASR